MRRSPKPWRLEVEARRRFEQLLAAQSSGPIRLRLDATEPTPSEGHEPRRALVRGAGVNRLRIALRGVYLVAFLALWAAAEYAIGWVNEHWQPTVGFVVAGATIGLIVACIVYIEIVRRMRRGILP